MESGRLTSLRRGMYALSPVYQKHFLSPLRIANELYRPSYLGGIWALGFFDLIPERVVGFTSIATRVTRTFVNTHGEFFYSKVRKDLFRNFSKREVDGAAVWISELEKALLDFWHLSPGKWDTGRMEEMRFQNFDAVDGKKLEKYATGFPPRVVRAVSEWKWLAGRESGA